MTLHAVTWWSDEGEFHRYVLAVGSTPDGFSHWAKTLLHWEGSPLPPVEYRTALSGESPLAALAVLETRLCALNPGLRFCRG